ncbi:MAG: flagellar biosynthesis protein FlhA [Verrucomicrobiia bacterium]
MAQGKSKLKLLFSQGDLWLVVGLFGTILILIFPVSPFMIDMLLATSIGLSLLVALVILYIKEPSEFTGFPTLLLFVTLFRLALNVASTRLILLDGYAGHIIEAFGNFVVRGNYVVGLVVFLILVLINFVVITKGAGRIAEVAARFTLDAMPGKQMAIDAELNAGIIDEKEAKARRRMVEQEADFYGAMDGASKFVRGDAIAAVLITLINIIGGFAIGIVQKGMSINEALQRYTLLSIGDGLVSQIPALITSVAAGILVTRAAARDDLGKELSQQLLFYPKALAILTVMLVIFSLVPGLPMIPFLALAACSGYIARRLSKSGQTMMATAVSAQQTTTTSTAAGETAQDQSQPKQQQGESMESYLGLDPLQIELGYGLVALADKRRGGDLLERITGVRRNFAMEMGIVIPPIRVRDNLQLGSNEYRFVLKGIPVARGELMPGYWLAMNATNSKVQLKGIPTVEPVFQLPATWVTDVEKKTAEINGYTVVDAVSVLVTHLTETLRKYAYELLSRQDVQNLLDNLKKTHPAVVNELVPAQLTVGQVQRILQNLLAEGVSIRNLAGILEKVSDYAAYTKNIDELTEYARKAVAPQIVKAYQTETGALRAITLDPKLEQQIAQGVRQTPVEITLAIDQKLAQHLVHTLSRAIQQLVSAGYPPVVLCAPQIRLPFKRFFESTFSDLVVLAYNEIPPKTELQPAVVIPCPS